MSAVRETVKRTNWNFVRRSKAPLYRGLSGFLKNVLLYYLHRWNPYTKGIIFQLQRMLCAQDPGLHRKGMYDKQFFYFENANPLSVYVQNPRVFI